MNLNIPGVTSQVAQNMYFPTVPMKDGMYLRELTFKSQDSKSMQTICQQIKDCMKRFKQKERDLVDSKNLAKPEALIASKDKRVYMDHLTIRPNLTGKKTLGLLETHANGVRFTARSGQHVDVNFSNVKHTFFQPCEDELIVLIHFHLHNPMMLKDKKTKDIQFYMETGNLVDDLDHKKR